MLALPNDLGAFNIVKAINKLLNIYYNICVTFWGEEKMGWGWKVGTNLTIAARNLRHISDALMCHCGHDVNWTRAKERTCLIKFEHNIVVTTLQQKSTKLQFEFPVWTDGVLHYHSFLASGAHFDTSHHPSAQSAQSAHLDSDDPARSKSHRQSRISPRPQNISALRQSRQVRQVKACWWQVG